MELSGIQYLSDLNFEDRRVFCRVDFNVPLDGVHIRDDARIRAALPTINYLREAGAKLFLASHLGRPTGRDPNLSLEPCAKKLAELINADVSLADDCVGDGVNKIARDLPPGEVAVLENLRFHDAEIKGDVHFCARLAAPFQAYVNDAFGTCHRRHTSMYGIVKHLPECAAGFLLEKEIDFLQRLLDNPKRPFVALLGGAKVSDKIDVIRSLCRQADYLLIGGAMALTLLKARGVQVGNSKTEDSCLPLGKELFLLAEKSNTKLLLPVDHIVANSIDSTDSSITTGPEIPEALAAFDIGPETLKIFTETVKKAGTVFWNGPMGVFESPVFQKGTFSLAESIGHSNAVSVIGGGDSAAAVKEAGLHEQISHMSTGGGASLRFVEGNSLPGLEALRTGHQFK
jgi:phosphoglycerate kinase